MNESGFRLDAQVAGEIVRRTMQIVQDNVNVMDARGVIVASGEDARLGDLHEGALLALMQGRVVTLDAPASDRLHGARPGINLPLRCDGEVVGVVGLTGEPEHLRTRGELVRMAAEMMLEQARLANLLRRDARLREELVQGLVASETPPAALTDWARRLGIDLAAPRVAAVIEIDGAALGVDAALDELQRLQDLLARPERGNLFAAVSLSEIVVLKPVVVGPRGWNAAEHRARIERLLARMQDTTRVGVRMALGNYFDGPGGLARSYYTARTALRVGRQRQPTGQAFFYEDLVLPVLLDDLRSGWRAEELRRPLARLATQDANGLLRRTLQAWLAHDMQGAATAKALHIHRNTLDYRLARIAEASGLVLARLEDRLRLYVACQLQDGAPEHRADM
ncbi:MAG: sugar diacid recognition domain-containing protein [Candidatus Dactylopiibacterium sp.]|nr:sugar diacid recognition domain-containing protein [Candidatus Dactylopiibacterium sp.]